MAQQRRVRNKLEPGRHTLPVNANDTSPVHLVSLEVGNKEVIINWADGHQSRYPNVWLRDRCTCEACGTSWTGIRFLEPGHISTQVQISKTQVCSQTELQIDWAPDGHESRYPLQWLRDNCLSEAAREQRRHHPMVWGGELDSELPRLDYDRVVNNPSDLYEAFERIRDYGFVLLTGGPDRPGEAERVASLIGPIEVNNYGGMFDMKVTPGATTISNTYNPATLHTDDSYRNMPTGIKSMHCLTPADAGTGFTVMVDGFKVGQVIKEEAPNVFELLCTEPLWFHRYYDDAHLRARACVFTRDDRGEVVGFRFQDRSLGPLDVEPEKFDELFGAVRALMEVLRRETLQVKFRLESGDAVLFDNHRVLHSRTAFTGLQRHLQICSVNRDEFLSQLRVLGRKYGRDSINLTLPRGALG